MTWDAFHRRGEVLRNVIRLADQRRDGVLPMDAPGVAETFGDELNLLAALQLRWHTRLAGAIEREMATPAVDLQSAVLAAWRTAASEMPGVRAIIDACTAAPSSGEMAAMLDRANRKDWTLLAAMAGKASPNDRAAEQVGREIEQMARAAYNPAVGQPALRRSTAVRRNGVGRRRAAAPHRESILERVRAHLVA